MMRIFMGLFITVLIILSFATRGFGQGCSDGGVCTAGILSEPGKEAGNDAHFIIQPGYHFAKGDDGTSVNVLMMEATYLFNSSAFVQIKVPYMMINGNLAKTNGIGDITLTFNGQIKAFNGHLIEGFLGARIGTGEADRSENGKPLPMVYQTNLGTSDLLLGARWSYKGWAGSLALQQPLVQNNENGFLKSVWENDQAAQKYSDSKKIERNSDIVARFDKTFISGNFVLTAGLIPIFHLGEDSYINENDERTKIMGSDGLTLNFALSAGYTINDWTFVKVFYGSPLITRDVQPAGLARSYSGGVSFGFRF
ncbi:MAG: hypothetical protein K9H16_11280 [Bacteroidales bacterium]|nr:hypothetical protein [Bacteroidales bacterium]